MSLSDIVAVTKDNDNWGGAGGWIWIIVLFLFMYGNGWNRNTTEQPVTEAGAAVGNFASQAFSALVTVPCNAPQATINVKALNATSVRIANIIVVKIA